MSDWEPSNSDALSVGKAAEHIVCADLLLLGYRAFLSDQGLPYDVIVDLAGRLLRLQVKACLLPRNLNCSGKAVKMGYSFYVRKRGKNGRKRLSDEDCDVVAMVALDVRRVAYMPIFDVGQTCQLFPMGFEFKGKYRRSHRSSVDGFPFPAALDRFLAGAEAAGGNSGLLRDAERIEFGGRRQRIAEWAKEYGIEASLISGRLHRGWQVADAITMKPSAPWARRKKAICNGSNGTV